MTSARDVPSPRVSRDAVLAVLRGAAEPQPIDALAAAVGLSIATVRFHLDHLRAAGLVTAAGDVRRGPGRPRVLYRAVPAEAVDEGAAYRLLAGLLAEELLRAADPAAPIDAGRRWADRLLPEGAGAGGGRDAAVAQLVDLLADGGFAPEHDPEAATIALHACPFMALAVERGDVVCAVHLGLARRLIERLAGPDVMASRLQLRPVLDGSGPCLVLLPRARTA